MGKRKNETHSQSGSTCDAQSFVYIRDHTNLNHYRHVTPKPAHSNRAGARASGYMLDGPDEGGGEAVEGGGAAGAGLVLGDERGVGVELEARAVCEARQAVHCPAHRQVQLLSPGPGHGRCGYGRGRGCGCLGGGCGGGTRELGVGFGHEMAARAPGNGHALVCGLHATADGRHTASSDVSVPWLRAPARSSPCAHCVGTSATAPPQLPNH